MRAIIALILIVGISSASAQGVLHGVSPDHVRLIEQQFVRPERAQPLDAYHRYYKRTTIADGREVVMGRYLAAAHFPLRASAVALPGISGAYAVEDLPEIEDGDCSVLTVIFVLQSQRLAPIRQDYRRQPPAFVVCNGR